MNSGQSQAPADPSGFEFTALSEARNYRRALISEFRPYLKGQVLEIGAGIGQITENLVAIPGVERVLAVEPDTSFCEEHRRRCAGHEVLNGTAADVPAAAGWDAIVSINVLEHIESDEAELSRYCELLRSKSGALCLFVPARPEIYAPIDKDFGHFRRYTRAELKEKLIAAGFRIESLNYFNCVGYFAWWANFCVLKKRVFEVAKVRAYDRLVFPVVHGLEARIMRPPFGQSLIAVGRADV